MGKPTYQFEVPNRTFPPLPIYRDMDGALAESEIDDDVVGSGVFSDEPNTHLGNGVFESTWGMPGYAAREPGTGWSEVRDQQSGERIAVITPGMMEIPNKWTARQLGPIHENQAPNWVNGIDMMRTLAPPAEAIWDRLDEGVKPVRARYSTFAGLGDDAAPPPAPTGASVFQWAAAGLIAGIAVALVAGTLNLGGKR